MVGTGARIAVKAVAWVMAGFAFLAAGAVTPAIAAALADITVAAQKLSFENVAGQVSITASVNDAAGNVYVTGLANANTLVVGQDVNGADVTLYGATGQGFVVKYNAAGQVAWGRRYSSSWDNQAPTGLALDGASPPNVYVAGSLNQTMNNFGDAGNETLTLVGNADSFVGKLDGGSGSISWIKNFGSAQLSLTATNLAVSSDGADVYLVGTGTGDNGSTIDFHTGRDGAFIAHITVSQSGQTLATLVPFIGDGGGNVALQSVVATSGGQVYAVGALRGGGLDAPASIVVGNTAGLLASYNATLADASKTVSTLSIVGNTPYELSAITADASNLYLTGTYKNANLVLNSPGGQITLTAASTNAQGFVAKASIADQTANPGRVQWAKRIGGSSVALVQQNALAVDTAGTLSVGVVTNGAGHLSSPPLDRVGSARNVALMRLSSDGDFDAGVSLGADTGFVLGNASGVASSGMFTVAGKMTEDFTVPQIAHGTNVSAGLLLRASPSYVLTVAKSGTGGGTVTSTTGGIDCGSTCTSTALAAGTTVTLAANAGAGSTFAGWSGACTGSTLTFAVTMDASRSCTAAFDLSSGPTPPTPNPPAPPAPPPPPFVVNPPATVENASTVGSGSGSVSFASSFTNTANLTFSAAPSAGGTLPSWLSFDPASVSFSFNVPLPPDLPIQPLAAGDARTGRADARANWSNTVYPLLLRVAQLPVVLTATDKSSGQAYASTIQMSFYAPRNPVAISALSMSLDRALGNKSSGRSALSFDGGQMLFETASTNLFAASPGPYGDIVRYHGLSGARDRLSQTAIPGGGVANTADGLSSSPAVSADGAFGAFASDAPAVSELPAGGKRQIYRVSLAYPRVALNPAVTPAPLMVSATAEGVAGNGTSDNPSLSQDGRFVAFDSTATNLAAGLDETRRVWRKDMSTGAIVQVAAGSNPSLSWNGQVVAYQSAGQIQVKDMAAGTVRTLGVGAAARLSARGDRVTFVSSSKVVQVDLATGAVRAVGDGDQPAMSADGRFVAFRAIGANGFTQVWLRDVDRGVTALVTQTASGTGGNGDSLFPSVSGDGAQVGFVSAASDLVNGSPTGIQAYVAANPLPLPEKTGYWYLASSNSGQGWLMERWGSQAYIAGLVYDAAGQATWLSGFCQVTGLNCAGTLVSRSGGTAFGAATGPSPVAGPGVAMTLTTSEDGRSTALQVGNGAVQTLTAFPIGGTATTGFAGLPQAGWWMETGSTGGNGYFIQVDTQPQADGSVRQIAYVSVLTFDLSGQPVWYSSQASLGADLGFSGTLMQYGAPTGVAAVGQLRIAFTGNDTAQVNLPNGRTASISRFRF